MASMLVFGYDKAILNGFAVLGGLAPGSVHFNAHKAYIKDYGYDKWVAALESEFSSYSDADLAKLLAVNTGLNKIKLNGDADPENIQLATDFIAANAGNRVAAILQFVEVFSKVKEGDLAPYASSFNAKIVSAYDYAQKNESYRDFNINEYNLTEGADKLVGSAADDLFNAWYNALNDGDNLDGGAGNDTLSVDIYAADAVTPISKSIENVLFRAQYKSGNSATDNNMATVQIDAQRMKDVTNWGSDNSRADLVIEDVRINNDQITKDITVTFRESDPGHVDFGLYFDQYSLRNVTNSTSRINVQILDTRAAVAGEDNLKGNADWGLTSFNFFVSADKGATWTRVSLGNEDVTAARTVEQMRAALQKAADAQFGAGAVEVVLGAEYTVTDTASGLKTTAKEISIVAKGALQIDATNDHATSTSGKAGWSITNVPSDTGLHSNWNQASVSSTDLVTSTVVLDDVGRGSTGGDLVIGGLSTGDTSTSKGVGRFEITVEDDSTLRTISSTNDTLQEVTIKNGTQDRQPGAYNPIDEAGGKLVVKGEMSPNDWTSGTAPSAKNTPLVGGSTSEYGFQDVRLIDGSAMTGKLIFNAELTQNAVDKYLALRDTQANPLTEDVAVAYTGGSNNDSMWVNVNQATVASNSKINPGKADFSFTFEGNAGNDTINVAIDRVIDSTGTVKGQSAAQVDLTGFDAILAANVTSGGGTTLEGKNEVWYHNQRSNNMRVDRGNYNEYNDKMVLSGGAGNDFIVKPGAGDVTINAGTGADVVFADNTGAQTVLAGLDSTGTPVSVLSKAAWGFGTLGNVTAAADPSALIVTNAKSVEMKTFGSWGVKVKVNYRGLESAEIALNDLNDYQATQLDINQAIKKAINEDAVLSKLLVASDGPGVSLLVQSKVDDVHTLADLTVSFIDPDVGSISNDIIKNYNAANGTSHTTNAQVLSDIQTYVTDKTAATALANAYNTQLAKDSASDIAGLASVTSSDNVIRPGVDTDTDVIVLGTTVGVDHLSSSNDIVKFEGVFGHDVIVNFNTSALAAGGDLIDFRSFFDTANATTYTYHGTAAAANSVQDASIEVFAYDDSDPERNDSAAEVKKLYDAADTATSTKAATELYVAVDTNGTGHVYKVTNGTAINDTTVELLGQLDIADGVGGVAITWNGLTAANFV